MSTENELSESKPKPYEGDEPYIFVSYSHKNADEVMPILKRLSKDGYRIWYDEGIEGGHRWKAILTKHIRNCCCFLLFITTDYIRSEHCAKEYEIADNNGCDFLPVYLKDNGFFDMRAHDSDAQSEKIIEKYDTFEYDLNVRQAIVRNKYPGEKFYEKLYRSENISPCKVDLPEKAPQKVAAETEKMISGRNSRLPERKTIKYGNGNVYEGEVADGQPNGKGIAKYANGNVYEGEWRDGEQNGRGIMKFSDGSTYDGEWKDGIRHGRGIVKTPNGVIYDGVWQNDLAHGRCVVMDINGKIIFQGEFRNGEPVMKDALPERKTIKYGNGNVYEGEVADGQPNGKGIAKYVNGNVYEGEWKDGAENGRGILKLPDSSTYDGEWKGGKQHGRGIIKFPDGSTYDGEWEDGLPNGRGIEKLSDGSTYDGEWKDGKRHGRGIMKFPNGSTYDGEWKGGKQQGRGIMKYPDGSIYDGEWKDGGRHGTGIMKTPNGDTYDGEWKNNLAHGKCIVTDINGEIIFQGEFQNGEPVIDDAPPERKTIKYENGNVYEGEIFDGKRHGKGIMKYQNGDVYNGEWEDDKRHGKGIMMYANGKTKKGKWKNDEYKGKILFF